MTDTATVPLIPREVLFGNPERMGPRLSPDGERLAYLAPQERRPERLGRPCRGHPSRTSSP